MKKIALFSLLTVTLAAHAAGLDAMRRQIGLGRFPEQL